MDVGRAPDQKPSPGQATHIGGLTPPAIESQTRKPFAKSKPLLQVTFQPARSMPIIGSGRFPGREDSKPEDIQRQRVFSSNRSRLSKVWSGPQAPSAPMRILF
jgi:hypothetical protein